ncbi:hypothetical protein D9M71_756840 [compost metagenome]
MHDRIWLMFLEHSLYFSAVTDIHFFESVTLATTDFRQRIEIAGIGQLIEVHHIVVSVMDNVADECRANEASTSGYDNFHSTKPGSARFSGSLRHPYTDA